MTTNDISVHPHHEQVAGARATYLERTAVFRSHGYDRQGSARFVIDQAGTWSGPVLDVGTGKGVQAVELAHRGLNVVTVDPDPQEKRFAALDAEAEGVVGRIRFVQADWRRLPFAAGSFGPVFLVDALHHFEEGAPVFAEMARVVRRDDWPSSYSPRCRASRGSPCDGVSRSHDGRQANGRNGLRGITQLCLPVGFATTAPRPDAGGLVFA